jgi:PAS domain S-box-containing protein
MTPHAGDTGDGRADRRLLTLDRLSPPAWRVMFAVAVGVLLVTGGVAAWLNERFASSTDMVEHTYRVLSQIDELVSRVIRAEGGQRGYLLTLETRFLQSYADVREDAGRLSRELRTLVADDAGQSLLAARLDQVVQARLDELEKVRVAHESGRTEEVFAGIARGGALMGDIESLAADMRAAENSLLVERGNQVRLARRGAMTFAGLTLALAVILAGVGLSLDRSFRTRKAEFDRELTARLEAERSAAVATAGLHASERLTERLLDSSADCVVLLESSGRVVSMNRPGLALLDLGSADDVQGRPWPDLWGPTGAQASQALSDAVTSGEGRFQGSRQSASGDERWWDAVVTPIRDRSGAVERLLCVARDVTGQKRHEEALRESEQRFRTLADAMPQIVWSTRADGYHDYFNERWYEYTGMPRPHEPGGEFDASGVGQGWNWKNYLHPADVDQTLTAWTHSLTTGEAYHVQYRVRRQDGVYRWFMGRALPLRDSAGAIVRWFGTCTDIQDEKRGEEERAQLLASERAARSEAERAARLKDEFVSTLSHELRTPLNAIMGWVGVLRQDARAENLDKGLTVIDRNLRRQSQMIDDLLDMSRIVSGKLRLDVHRVDMATVIEEAVSSALPAADAKAIRLTTVLGSAAVVQGDPGRLQQVVWNLVANAVKFTPRGGRVQVTLRKANSQVVVEVSDTGMGIAPEFLPHIFQRFRQADASATRAHGGLGLGLAIVKNLVEMHGGSVEASSEGPDRGSVFTVRLPVALAGMTVDRPSEPATTGIEPLGPQLESVLLGLRILVVDDEPDAREVVQWLLEAAGAETTVCDSAEGALNRLEAGFVPDIIVSDIGMPERDGYDFMKRVRQMATPVAQVPAAALTALARGEDRKRALLAGYQTHLAKPVDPTELVALVASLAGRTGRARS